jgi:hypothetical protein
MSDNTTTYPIPRGWRRVTRGRTHEGDKGWGISRGKFLAIPAHDISRSVTDFYCIIRRVKGGAR